MNLNPTGFDRAILFGQPFHGLWKAGSITLPNAATKTCPAPLDGSCVMVRVPGQPAVVRSDDEEAADASAGREWLNYALISGGRYGPVGPIGIDNSAIVFYIDSTKKRWLVRFEKDSFTTGGFFLRVRRFGHIDGTTQSWSAAQSIMLPAEIWGGISFADKLTGHAQNSTGSEAVIGTSKSLLRLTLSGDVDTSAAGYGLTVGNELIEYEGRPCIARQTRTTTNGVFTETMVDHYFQQDNSTGLPTGVTYDRTRVWVDGALTEDNGAPAPVSGFTWVPDGQDYTVTSAKTKIVEYLESGTKYIGAGFHADALRMVGQEYAYTSTETTTWSNNATSGLLESWKHTVVTKHLKSKIGTSVIYDHAATLSDSTVGPTALPSIPHPVVGDLEDGYDDTVTFYTFTWEYVDPLVPWEDYTASTVAYKRSTYLMPLIEPVLSGWKNPVMALVTQARQVGYGPSSDVYSTQSVHAPSLATQTTAIDIADLHASWHPHTDQVAVDTAKVCWF